MAARRSGQIAARGERKWLVRWYVSVDAKGKRRYSSKIVHGTKRDAQKYLNLKLRSQDLGQYVEPARVSLDAYLDKWLETASRPNVATRTYEDYQDMLARYVRPSLGGMRLDALRPLDIQGLIGELEGKKLSPRTVRIAHRILKSALEQAIDWGMLASNPAARVKLPKGQRQEMRALSQEEVKNFREKAEGERWRVLFDFALATGMRPSEYLALAWQDLNLEAGTATVRRSLAKIRGGWEFKEPKTKGSRRSIPLPQPLVANMKKHRRTQAEAALKLGPAYNRELDLVFASEVGEPLDRRNLVQRHFKKIVKAAELPSSLRLYDLRHTCCTLLLASGVNVKVVSERLGHASAAMTLDVYGHVLPGMQEEATQRLGELLFS